MTSPSSNRTVVVCGATGRQGGAVARRLVADGWHVRALTRKPGGARARALAERGAEVVRADMGDRESLERALAGAYGVYSVQNPMLSSTADEIRQGKNVAEAAASAGVRLLVYGSAGIGRPTGVGSWDSKLAVEEHMRNLGLPVTVLRPMAFMELMTDRTFYPHLSTWQVMAKLVGPTTKLPWLAVDDLGVVAAKAFADPARFVGRELLLAADVLSLEECRALWKRVRGRGPRRVPIPAPLFERLGGTDLTTMWRWLGTGEVPLDTGPTREVHAEALTVAEWLTRERRKEERWPMTRWGGSRSGSPPTPDTTAT